MNPTARISAAFLVVLALVALFAPWLAPHDPMAIQMGEELRPPSAEHWLGQDLQGSDILSRMVHGSRTSLGIALAVVMLSGGLGVLLGALAGHFGGVFDQGLMRLVDVLLAFPGLLLAIALVAVLGPAPEHVVIALVALGWVSFARLARGQVLVVRERAYVLAARSMGQSEWRILVRHVLPNIMAPVIVQATFGLASVVLAESSLAFLGLGAPPGSPSWGAMLSEGKRVLFDAPHVSIVPGVAILLVVLAFNLLGDHLRDRWDPKAH